MSDSGVPAPISRAAVKRKRDERVRRRARRLRTAAPWVGEPRYSHLIQRYSALGVLFDSLCENARRFGLVNDLGEPRPILDSIRRMAGTLLAYDREMLLTPLSSTGVRTRPPDIFDLGMISVPPIAVAITEKPE